MISALFSVVSLSAGERIIVSLRIEGIENCLYYSDISLEKGSTVYDAVIYADETDDSLTVVSYDSQYGAYIESINNIAAGSYTDKKWDGWSYRVNGKEPSVGVSAYSLEDKDEIVIYYADPWNTGMQYPEPDISDLAEGKISFSSFETVYDENYNATQVRTVITDYILIWYYGNGKYVELLPDEKGICEIPSFCLAEGEHRIQIEKTDKSTGLPTLLRFAPDFTVNVPESNSFLAKIMTFFRMIYDALIRVLNIFD